MTIRTERRFGVTGQLEPAARSRLMYLRESDTWQDLLDVMEMQCIEIETDLINTAPHEEEKVIANHRYAKAAWVIFGRLQQKVDDEIQVFVRSQQRQPEQPQATIEEQWQAHLLDPLKPAPEGQDYFGI